MEPINLTPEILKQYLKPRACDSNKGTFGTLTIFAGCSKFRGAASMCILSALRCGAGIVTLASTEPVITSAAAKIYESTYIPLTSNINGESSFSENQEIISNQIKKSTAVCAGCGMGMSYDTAQIIKFLIKNTDCQLILDADALNSISKFMSPLVLADSHVKPIITPHIGEMARLCNKYINDIKINRAGYALDFSKKFGCITILKDNITFISDGEKVFSSNLGSPGLARGGSGDCLAGIVSSLAAQKYLSPLECSLCAVVLHSLASQKASKKLSITGMLPSDLPNALCEVFLDLKI